MAGKCPAITAAGAGCRGYVHPGKTYCPAHDPARAEARKKAASKAGKSKHPEIVDIKKTLRKLASDVLEGDVERATGSVTAQILGVLLRAIETERRIRETEELEERLVALENAAEERRAYGL